MALRDQPYLPLYIQDIMTDEKLNECSAATHGVYIKGIMCLMHKSETYGKLLLKQKYKQNSSECFNFALMLANHLPYTFDVILSALTELIQEKVCYFEGDFLVQKRMVHDGEVSLTRSLSGREGGKTTQKNNKEFALAKVEAKVEALPEYEYEYNNKNINKEEYIKKEEYDFPKKEEVERVFIQQGGTKEMAELFFNKHSAVGWVANGSKIKNFSFLVNSFIINWNKNLKNADNNKSDKAAQPKIKL